MKGRGRVPKRTERRKCEGQRTDTVWKAMKGSNPGLKAKGDSRETEARREVDRGENNGARRKTGKGRQERWNVMASGREEQGRSCESCSWWGQWAGPHLHL